MDDDVDWTMISFEPKTKAGAVKAAPAATLPKKKPADKPRKRKGMKK